jgi:hypothetical protein
VPGSGTYLAGTNAGNLQGVAVDGSGRVAIQAPASLPLPAGAATAAKQPAPGTAGTPSADVISVQGAASMTALKVDGSAVAQPVVLSTSAPAAYCPNTIAVNQTASTDLYTSTNKIYVCSIVLISATQQGLSLAEGTGSVCGTGTAYLLGGSGGTAQIAANSGFSTPSALPWLKSKTTADHLCLIQSGSGNVSGTITYADAS